MRFDEWDESRPTNSLRGSPPKSLLLHVGKRFIGDDIKIWYACPHLILQYSSTINIIPGTVR